MSGHTPGPWTCNSATFDFEGARFGEAAYVLSKGCEQFPLSAGNARLIAAAPDLLAALTEARRAIGDHFAPNDCYATGPLTGDPIRDLVQCPACLFIAMHDAAIAKATGSTGGEVDRG